MVLEVPLTQKAVVIRNPGPDHEAVVVDDVPVGELGPYDVLVKLSCSGVCGSEVRALLGWSQYNTIIGHEGVGIVVKAGEDVDSGTIGSRVGVKWLYTACGSCSFCTKGLQHYCPKQLNTSRHVPGTLQQYVVADARYVSKIPDGLADETAAPLLCAGLTMAGAISRLDGVVSEQDWVVISGSGGGLGHIGVQIASRLRNLRVIAVDTGSEKKDLSLKSGAEVFVDFSTENVASRVAEITGDGAAAVLVVSGAQEAFQIAPQLVRNMGTIVCVGLPRNDFNIPISATGSAARGLTIIGSHVGSEAEMDELLQLALAGKITPAVEVVDFAETPAVLEKIRHQKVPGRIVVRIP